MFVNDAARRHLLVSQTSPVTRRHPILKRIAIVVLLVGLALVGWTAYFANGIRHDTQILAVSTATVHYVVDPTDATFKTASYGPDFDVTSGNGVVLSIADHLFEIHAPFEAANMAPVKVVGVAPSSFALDNDDDLLTITDGYFGMLDEHGESVDAVPLPYENMRLARSTLPGVVYLYGGASGNFRVYSFAEDGSFRILVEIEEPIVAVTDNTSSIYIATASGLYRIAEGHLTRLLDASDGELGGPIVSAAVSADDVLFFATAQRVYALKDAGALGIVDNSGGALRWRDDILYVEDGERGLVYTVQPATMQIFSGSHR
jgi:hypothetical protein